MKFKEYLRSLIKAKEGTVSELRGKIKTAATADEVRALGDTLDAVLSELQDAKDQLADAEEADPEEGAGAAPGADTGRSAIPEGAVLRGGNPMASYRQNVGGTATEARQELEPYSTMEYRKGFMDYVQRGTPISQEVIQRAGGDKGTTVAADIGMIIPMTIMNEFIKEVSKVYGQIYSKVRKINVQGGVKFPISKLKAQFKWITETTVSEKQKAGDIKDFVEFSYNIGEIRVSQTLLSQVLSLSLFESEITRIMVEAYVEMMDKMIISGTGSGQPLGITKDTRVTNVVEFTEAEFADWTAWRKNLFAIIPLSKRGQGEFLFPSATVESYLLTMKDKNDRPLFREATDLTIGTDGGKFYGRDVTLVEPDVIADFATAAAGDVVGIYWVPNDYTVNTNMNFGMKRYFDEDTNEWINKGLTIVDGKILDTTGCYLIKKKATTAK